MDVVRCAGEECWDGPDEKTSCKCVSWTEAIACGTSNQANEECCDQSNDVRVTNLVGGEVEVFFDDVVEQRWERIPRKTSAFPCTDRWGWRSKNATADIPRPESDHKTKPREEEHPSVNIDGIQ